MQERERERKSKSEIERVCARVLGFPLRASTCMHDSFHLVCTQYMYPFAKDSYLYALFYLFSRNQPFDRVQADARVVQAGTRVVRF